MSLLAGAFLLGLGALALPLWLHRMSQRAPAERDVSSLMLMRETDEPIRTRRTLAHKILLALRLAALTAIVLAFAQPMLRTIGEAGTAGDASARLVLVDGSFSMRGGAWAEAVGLAGDLVRDVDGSRIVVAGERLTLIDEVGTAQPGFGRFDFAGLPARLDALTGTLAGAEQGPEWEVHVLSDFQASAMPQRFNALVEGAKWPTIPHRLGGERGNWAIKSATITGGRLEAVIAGPDGADMLAILRRGGEEVARRPVVAMPDARADPAGDTGSDDGNQGNPLFSKYLAVFDVPPAGRARVHWEVHIANEDAIAEDNVFRVVQPARNSLDVAVLSMLDDESAAMTFLVAALNAIGIESPIRIDADDAWPDAVDAVVAVDPGGFPAPLQRRLERHLADGGGALLIAGTRLQASGALPLTDEPLTGSIAGGIQRVVVVDAGHPVARTPWQGVEVERSLSFATGPGETILALAPSDASGHQAALGKPLVVEQRLGKGRLLILATALDRDWTNLVVRPSFVEFVQRAIDYLAANLPRDGIAGEALAVPATAVQIFDAEGRRILALDDTAGRPVVRIERPGFYSVRTPGRETTLAVNVDPRESDLRSVPDELLARWQDAAMPLDTRPATARDSARDESDWRPLAFWLLALAAVLLALEALAANVGRMDFWHDVFPQGRTA